MGFRDDSDDLAEAFYAINAAWIASMFTLEEKDLQILRTALSRARSMDVKEVVPDVE